MERVYKFGYIKKKPSYLSKDTINKVKHQTRTQGNLFVIHITTKVLCPGYDEKSHTSP